MDKLKIFIWFQVLLIFLVSIDVYRYSRIKYSGKIAIDLYDIQISYRNLYLFLAYTVFILNIVMIHYTNQTYIIHQALRKYWYYLLPLYGAIVIYIIKPKPIIDDGSFVSQPSMMKRKNVYRLHIFLVLLLISSILIEIFNAPYFMYYTNKKIAYMGISRIITLIIMVYLTIKEKNMSNCKYQLPKNWV